MMPLLVVNLRKIFQGYVFELHNLIQFILEVWKRDEIHFLTSPDSLSLSLVCVCVARHQNEEYSKSFCHLLEKYELPEVETLSPNPMMEISTPKSPSPNNVRHTRSAQTLSSGSGGGGPSGSGVKDPIMLPSGHRHHAHHLSAEMVITKTEKAKAGSFLAMAKRKISGGGSSSASPKSGNAKADKRAEKPENKSKTWLGLKKNSKNKSEEQSWEPAFPFPFLKKLCCWLLLFSSPLSQWEEEKTRPSLNQTNSWN